MTGIRAGGSDISRIMCGGEAERIVVAGVDIWRRKYEFSEPFDTEGNLTAYANWVEIDSTSTVRLSVSGGELSTTGTTTDGTYTRRARHVNPLNTDVGYVQARIAVRSPTAYDSYLYFGADAGIQNCVFVVCSTDTSTRGLWTGINNSGTRRISFALPSSGTIRLTRTNMGSYYRYQVANVGTGAVLGTWDDTGNLVNVGPDYRYCGLGCITRRAFFSTSYSNGWDDFYMTDF